VRTVLVAVLAAAALQPAGAAADRVGNGVIAFGRTPDVFTVDPNTLVQRNLTADVPGGFHGAAPFAWSPDGKHLAYGGAVQVSPGSYRSTPSVMSADGSGKRQLVSDLSRYFEVECWLSDDTVVVKSTALDSSSSDFWAVRADGTGLRALTSDGGQKSAAICSQPTDRVFYERTASAVSVPYYASGTGGAPVRLKPDGILPVPSPDGLQLAFTTVDGVFVENLDGSGLVKLSSTSPAGGLAWSPDGHRIAFADHRVVGYFRGIESYTSDVRVIGANGLAETALTTAPGDDLPIAWSPDGTRILFSSSTRGLMVMNADGTCETSVLGTVAADTPAWQPVPSMAPQAAIVCVDLGLSGTADPLTVGIGGTVIYRFEITNDGSETASNVTFDGSHLPKDTVRASIDTNAGSCLPTFVCQLGPLKPGATAGVTVGLISTFRGPLASFAGLPYQVSVSGPEPDSDPTNNQTMVGANAYPCSKVGTYQPDVLRGTGGSDSICGLSGGDTIFGFAGNDRISGGPGTDTIYGGPGKDVIFGGGERDTIFADDGQRDDVDCGTSRDIVIADRLDVLHGCEVISRSPVRCGRIGTVESDSIVGTSGADRICGLPGGDTIDGLTGNDQLDGGDGNDTLNGGPGRDRIYGGAGYDVILARDGERDTIDCGTQVDTVVADRVDRVARNCEHVQRKG